MPKNTVGKRKTTVDRYIDRYPLPKTCPYCNKKIVYVDSTEIYGKSYGMVYMCRPCNAYVGVHKGTHYPLGSLANLELREKRKEAHYYFDQLWRIPGLDGSKKAKKRLTAYKWLAKQLYIAREKCHIGFFDISLCNKTIQVSKDRLARINKANNREYD